MAVNPSFPPVPEPLADLQALVAVTRALKQRVEALTASVGVLSQGGTVVSPAGSTGGSSGGGGGGYILPVASTVTLGGVVVDGVTVLMAGPVLSAQLPAPAEDTPVMSGGAGAIGVGSDYARWDHQHPHDTSNPENYQNAGDVALSIASSAYHLTAAAWGALDLHLLPTSDPGGGKPWLNGGVLQVGP